MSDGKCVFTSLVACPLVRVSPEASAELLQASRVDAPACQMANVCSQECSPKMKMSAGTARNNTMVCDH